MFRFTIRDLLWLTIVVGMALAWYADGMKVRAEKRRAEQDAADYWRVNLPVTKLNALVEKYNTPQRRGDRL